MSIEAVPIRSAAVVAKTAPRRRQVLCAGVALLVAPWAIGEEDQRVPGLERWDASRFDEHSTRIDNPWLPMQPGMRYVYEGTTAEDDGKVVPHSIEVNITDLTKLISGVRVLLTYDRDIQDGELAEAELAMYAQDKDGNVWRMGEYPEEYDNEKFSKAPAWIHGFEGALAGIEMPAKPALGTPSFPQGWGPSVNWNDRGQIHAMGETVKVRAGAYQDVLVIKETSAAEAEAYQLKYYASGVGNVKVGWSGADQSKETLELTHIEQLDAKAMNAMRKKALALEASGYAHSKTVFAKTPRAQRLKPAT